MHICRFCSLLEAQTSDHTRLGFSVKFHVLWTNNGGDGGLIDAQGKARCSDPKPNRVMDGKLFKSRLARHAHSHAHMRYEVNRGAGCPWELSFGRCYIEWVWETQLLCPCVNQCELFLGHVIRLLGGGPCVCGLSGSYQIIKNLDCIMCTHHNILTLDLLL